MIHLRKKKKEEHTPKVKKKTGIIQSILNPIGFAKKLYDDDQVMTNAATVKRNGVKWCGSTDI